MKKTLLLVFTIAFGLVLIAACSANETNTGEAPDTENGTEVNEEENDGAGADNGGEGVESDGDRPTVSMLITEHASWPYQEDWLVWDIIEEEAGVNLDITVTPDMAEQINLIVASGDMPDMIHVPTNDFNNDLGAQGALTNILDYVDIMPNFQAWMEEYPEYTERTLSEDGSMYLTPNEGFGLTNRMIWLYREDIFEEHDLEVPSTFDELYEVSKELKEIYPDSYPFSFRGDLSKIGHFGHNFETQGDYYYDFNANEWRYGPVEDNYRDMIEHLNVFYEEGLIPPDFLSMETGQWEQLMSSDEAFITMDYIGRIDNFNVPLREDNPEYTMAFMPPPAGWEGGPQLNPYTHILDNGFMVSSTTENAEAVMQLIDWMYTEEARELLSWGIEGETYSEESGERVLLADEISQIRVETGLATNGAYLWFDYDAHLSIASEENVEAYELAEEYDADLQPVVPFNSAELETLAIQGDSISSHTEQEISKFIIGERDLSEWDEYVTELNNLGLEQMIEMYDEAYQRVQEVDIE